MALMAKAKTVMAFMAVVVLIGAADVVAQSADCQAELATLVPCLGFVSGGDQKPSEACCTAFAKAVATNASCLCDAFKGNSGINVTKALTLPQACNVTTPSVSMCNSAPAYAPLPGVGSAPPQSGEADTSNAGAVFAPSMVTMVCMAVLVLMKTLSLKRS